MLDPILPARLVHPATISPAPVSKDIQEYLPEALPYYEKARKHR